MTFYTCNDCGTTFEIDDGKTKQKTGLCNECFPKGWKQRKTQQIAVIKVIRETVKA